MNPQAQQLNQVIQAVCPVLLEMLSERGRAIYFPKLGILAQTADAAGKDINATIGIALEDDGRPVALPCIAGRIQLPAAQVFPYAPSPGRPDLRQAWQKLLVSKNPGLTGKRISLPVVTSALTHGLSLCGYLFCDPTDRIILPDLFWENYELIFSLAYGAGLCTFPTFTAQGGFNLAGLRAALGRGAPGKRVVCLNFPNNPTGYSPTRSEVTSLVTILREAAEQGSRIVVIIDDAYFGLVYEPEVYPESVFSLLCDLHPNILAIKLDGPTKEDYVWGFRVGFMTYGIPGATAAVYAALEAKTGGAIRGMISNSSNPGQALLLRAYADPHYAAEKKQCGELLRRRYLEVKRILAAHPEYREEFEPLPFNSGYFMCLRLRRADPESVRQRLLADYSTGVIVMNGLVRLAFSATPTAKLETLCNNLYQAARRCGAADQR